MPEDNGNTPSLNFPPIEQFENSYDVFEEVGNGQFAVVKRCVHKHTGAEYAAKFIRKRKLANSRRGAKRADVEREVMVLREVSGHANVISLYEVYESSSDVVLILELVPGGELFHHVYAKEFLSEQEAIGLVRQILVGLLHLHSRHIAHLDLKPENVMLQSKCSGQVKLIDFGLSRKIMPGSKIKDMIGTPEFVAPEIVNYDCLSMATDVWALGVITYILLSGLSPFMGETRDLTFCNITAVNYTFDDEQFASVSNTAKDFIRKTFVRDPNRRATCEQLLRHPWLEVSDKNKMLIFLIFSTKTLTKLFDESIISNKFDSNVHRLKSLAIKRHWKLIIRVVVICNYLIRCSRTNAIRKSTKEYRKAKTVLLECLPNANSLLCSSSTLGLCSSSKSCDNFHTVVQQQTTSASTTNYSIFGLRFLTVCTRPKLWLASSTAAVFVGSCSVLGCLCLAFYSKHLDGYVYT